MTRSLSRARRGLLTAGVSAVALRRVDISATPLRCVRLLACAGNERGPVASGVRYLRASSKRSAAIGAPLNGHCCARPVHADHIASSSSAEQAGSGKSDARGGAEREGRTFGVHGRPPKPLQQGSFMVVPGVAHYSSKCTFMIDASVVFIN